MGFDGSLNEIVSRWLLTDRYHGWGSYNRSMLGDSVLIPLANDCILWVLSSDPTLRHHLTLIVGFSDALLFCNGSKVTNKVLASLLIVTAIFTSAGCGTALCSSGSEGALFSFGLYGRSWCWGKGCTPRHLQDKWLWG